MAYTPYIRWRTNSLNLGGIPGPVFPAHGAYTGHTVGLIKPEYSITNRYHGTTRPVWRSEGILETDRDTIWTFWDTTIGKGYEDVTAIDSRGRMLFETSWNEWQEEWRKYRGGVYAITYSLESAIEWTPPCWGCYPTTTNSLVNHNLSGDDLSLDDGTLVDAAGDAVIYRQNGYALKLTGLGASAAETGASGTVSWPNSTAYGNIGLFCQFYAPTFTNGSATENLFHIMSVNDGTNTVNIGGGNVGGTNIITGEATDGSGTTHATKSDTSYLDATAETWYDLCYTYDAINGDHRFYYATSVAPASTFTNFLAGSTDQEDGILSTATNVNGAGLAPPATSWATVKLLDEAGGMNIIGNQTVYIQNAFFFDGFVTPVTFNTLRRLCHYWNSRSSGTWPA